MAYASKVDQAAAARRHYERNRELIKSRAAAYKRQHRDRLRQIIRDAKDQPCMDCGKSYPYYVMQFDHVGEDKEDNIADICARALSVERLMREIAKCEVVCANCHAERSHQRRTQIIPA